MLVKCLAKVTKCVIPHREITLPFTCGVKNLLYKTFVSRKFAGKFSSSFVKQLAWNIILPNQQTCAKINLAKTLCDIERLEMLKISPGKSSYYVVFILLAFSVDCKELTAVCIL